MELRQLSAPADPGFRLDLDGTARFLHEGYTVTVQGRRATAEDAWCYYDPLDRHDVLLTGTVTLQGVDAGTAYAIASELDAHSMRQALEEVLREAVDDVRRTAARLSARVEEIDHKHRTQQP
ncbi:hypothetical protein OG883_45020 [Streptomyces sp. NBC_01142]|uniref:hypothetical protein n=1 Tax=Streptomyces sp. NBC_01142 TaxID=2975865 RepID=UPI002250DA97|nr:hypothetical protein [Streptomyces sp. NBC_01142]MCX4826802.1 hypothetical protein [Streptomyces sp. NBC_01142]